MPRKKPLVQRLRESTFARRAADPDIIELIDEAAAEIERLESERAALEGIALSAIELIAKHDQQAAEAFRAMV